MGMRVEGQDGGVPVGTDDAGNVKTELVAYPADHDRAEMETRFTYHAPKDDQPARYQRIRGEAKSLAETINACSPPSRERSLALTNLEQAVMWANAAIARRE